MRRLALTVPMLGALLATAPAGAQTYAPSSPVCMHVYGKASYFDCSYSSLPQCNASASGRAAQCVLNPYYATASVAAPPVRHRHPRRAY